MLAFGEKRNTGITKRKPLGAQQRTNTHELHLTTSPAGIEPRGLFVRTPETFLAYFGCHNSLYIFATPRSKPSNFAIPLDFLILKTYQKISFSKQADCNLTTGFSRSKSSRDFRETEACFSKVPRTFRARKATCQTAICLC